MPSRLRPLTTWGEASLTHLSSRFADHLYLNDLSVSDGGNMLRGRHRTHDPAFVRCGNTLVDLVAVTEDFASTRLLALHPTMNPGEVMSWEKRKGAWKSRASIDLTQLTGWAPLYGFVEARNALQHGLGRLTTFQLERHRDAVLKGLKDAQIVLMGDRVCIDADAVQRSLHTCEQFIISLDRAGPLP